MRIATWNINGLKARLEFVQLWLRDRAPDVVGLQVMGYELAQVGYLRYAMELRNLTLDDIQTVGLGIEDVRVSYQDHSQIAEQLTWPLENDWRGVIDRG